MAGLGQIALVALYSWVGKGLNEPLEPASVEEAIDEETLQTLARQTGFSLDEILDWQLTSPSL